MQLRAQAGVWQDLFPLLAPEGGAGVPVDVTAAATTAAVTQGKSPFEPTPLAPNAGFRVPPFAHSFSVTLKPRLNI